MKKIPTKKPRVRNTLQESLRRFGHMLAMREQRGDESEEYQIKRSSHHKMLQQFYNR